MAVEFRTGLKVLRVIARHTIDEPVLARAIEETTGVNTRIVSDIVSIAASEGLPFGSGSRGYFKWKNAEQRQSYIDTEKSRLIALGEKLSAIEKSATNELSLFESEAGNT